MGAIKQQEKQTKQDNQKKDNQEIQIVDKIVAKKNPAKLTGRDRSLIQATAYQAANLFKEQIGKQDEVLKSQNKILKKTNFIIFSLIAVLALIVFMFLLNIISIFI